AREALVVAMAAFAQEPRDGGLESLRDRIRRIIGDAAEAKNLCDQANEAVRIQAARKIEAGEAGDKLKSHIDKWDAAWRAALAETGLPSNHTIEAASTTLEIVNELDVIKSKIDELTHRIEAMGDDTDAFRRAVVATTASLPDAPTGAAAEACRRLEERLRA